MSVRTNADEHGLPAQPAQPTQSQPLPSQPQRPGPPDPAAGTPEQFVTDFFTSFTRDVLGEEVIETVHDRYHTEDVVEIVDGNRLGRDKLVAHLRPVRRNLDDFSFDVHEAMRSGNRISARFTVHGVVRGNAIDTEVALFGEFTEDGRLRRSHQLTRTKTAGQD